MLLVCAHLWTAISKTTLFWAAFLLTRPLGAVLGDFLDKPKPDGGMALSRPLASAVIGALIVVLIIALPQRPSRQRARRLNAIVERVASVAHDLIRLVAFSRQQNGVPRSGRLESACNRLRAVGNHDVSARGARELARG